MDGSDQELLEAWRAGDKGAGSALFERHFDALYRFFRNKLGGGPVTDTLDDLIQETFLGVVSSKDRFRGDGSFRTYLFTIARHELFAYWNERKRREDDVDVSEISIADLATSPSGVLAARREQRLLLNALRAIPLDLQVALELHYWEKLDGPDLAVILGIPEGTVRSRLRRGREILEAKMAELAGDPDLLSASLQDLDRWAASLGVLLQTPE